MKTNDKITTVGAAIGMLLLILDGKTALIGAQDGLELCIRTVVPSLFPFFVLSSLLTHSLQGSWLRPLGILFRIPAGTEGILIPGILGGYPAGAQSVHAACHTGSLSKAQAEHFLAFANNAGPSFIFGMIAPQFSSPFAGWLLWGLHLSGAIMAAQLAPDLQNINTKTYKAKPLTVSQAMQQGIRTIATVCGWVILFRIILTFFSHWFLWLLPDWLQILMSGILELSNGSSHLQMVRNEGLRFMLCTGMLGFGGLCVVMQTVSVTPSLNLHWYFRGKLIQCAFSILCAYFIQLFFPTHIIINTFWLTAIGIVGIFAFFMIKQKNSSRNPYTVRV